MLASKKPKVAEIEITLFEYCPYSCSFCEHDKNSKVGMSLIEMASKALIVEDFIKNKMDKDITNINIQLVGGELLTDDLIDQHYLAFYLDLIKKIDRICKRNKKAPQINLVSSLNFTRMTEVYNFIARANELCPMNLIASYDLHGRYMSDQWKKNIEFFKDRISVSVVMTKPMIESFIKKKDPYFDSLYERFDIYFDTFIPDKKTSYLIPSDDDFLALLKHITLNYPSIAPFSEIIEKVKGGMISSVAMNCLSLNKITIFPDNSVSNCRWKRYTQSDFRNKLDYEDNTIMMKDHVDHYNCLSCNYFQQCPMRCFTQWSWIDRKTNSSCVMKDWFDWLQ